MRNFQQFLAVLFLLSACSTVQRLEQDAEHVEQTVATEAERIGYEIPQHIDPVIKAVESPAVRQVMHTVMTGAKYAAMATSPAGQAELVHEAVDHFRQRFAASLADPANAEHDPETVANAVLDQTLADKQQEWTAPADTTGADRGLP